MGPSHADQAELAFAYVLEALEPGETAPAETHIASCTVCRREVESLAGVVDRFFYWPTDVLRPPKALKARLVQRMAHETGTPPVESLPPASREPDWEPVAPGIECKLLAGDVQRERVSMLVRLAPGASYPPHRHAGTEELHLLAGELWIDGRRLVAGDYNRGAPDASDDRVMTETGCTCLLITSTRDILS